MVCQEPKLRCIKLGPVFVETGRSTQTSNGSTTTNSVAYPGSSPVEEAPQIPQILGKKLESLAELFTLQKELILWLQL